jgi:hypothetical protein
LTSIGKTFIHVGEFSEENKSNQIFLVLDFSLAIIGNVRDSQKEGLSAKIEK